MNCVIARSTPGAPSCATLIVRVFFCFLISAGAPVLAKDITSRSASEPAPEPLSESAPEPAPESAPESAPEPASEPVPEAAPGITPEKIVERADYIRFPQEAFQVDVAITTTKPEQDTVVKKYRILSKGNDRTMLMTMAPAIDKGQILLMRDHDLWAFLPNLSQPVRLPLSAKLTGEVSNGDIARANFAGDYDATLLEVEEIDGKPYYKLELNAARRGVTYSRVHYWVNQATFRPLQAEFYSVSGRLIKTCLFENYEEMAGEIRPTQMVMVDAVTKKGRSVLEYRNMKRRKLPSKVFTKQYLKKLSR